MNDPSNVSSDTFFKRGLSENYKDFLKSNSLSDETSKINISQEGSVYKITIDMKDFDPDNISLKVINDRQILIEGRQIINIDGKNKTKNFSKSVNLPGLVANQIEAVMSSDGMFNISVPVQKKSSSSEIKIPISHTSANNSPNNTNECGPHQGDKSAFKPIKPQDNAKQPINQTMNDQKATESLSKLREAASTSSNVTKEKSPTKISPNLSKAEQLRLESQINSQQSASNISNQVHQNTNLKTTPSSIQGSITYPYVNLKEGSPGILQTKLSSSSQSQLQSHSEERKIMQQTMNSQQSQSVQEGKAELRGQDIILEPGQSSQILQASMNMNQEKANSLNTNLASNKLTRNTGHSSLNPTDTQMDAFAKEKSPSRPQKKSNISENENFYKIILDIEDFATGDVKVRVSNNDELVIVGEVDSKELHCSKNSFKRAFHLKEMGKPEDIAAYIRSDGIMTVIVPKKGSSQEKSSNTAQDHLNKISRQQALLAPFKNSWNEPSLKDATNTQPLTSEVYHPIPLTSKIQQKSEQSMSQSSQSTAQQVHNRNTSIIENPKGPPKMQTNIPQKSTGSDQQTTKPTNSKFNGENFPQSSNNSNLNNPKLRTPDIDNTSSRKQPYNPLSSRFPTINSTMPPSLRPKFSDSFDRPITPIPITHMNSFFDNSYFQKEHEAFLNRVNSIRQQWGFPGTKDFMSFRNNANLGPFREENQATAFVEESENYKITVDVNGFSSGDLKVQVLSNDQLVIEGTAPEGGKSFKRHFHIPSKGNIDEINSTLSTDGVLCILVPKKKSKEVFIPINIVDEDAGEGEQPNQNDSTGQNTQQPSRRTDIQPTKPRHTPNNTSQINQPNSQAQNVQSHIQPQYSQQNLQPQNIASNNQNRNQPKYGQPSNSHNTQPLLQSTNQSLSQQMLNESTSQQQSNIANFQPMSNVINQPTGAFNRTPQGQPQMNSTKDNVPVPTQNQSSPNTNNVNPKPLRIFQSMIPTYSIVEGASNFPILTRGDFFNDSFFSKVQEEYRKAMDNVLQSMNIQGSNDLMNTYKNLRTSDLSEDSQAVSITQDETSHKIVIDVDAYKDGEISVRAISNNEIIIEGKMKGSNKVSSQSSSNFRRCFYLQGPIDMKNTTSAISTDGVLTIIAPKKQSTMKQVDENGQLTDLQVVSNPGQGTSWEQEHEETESGDGFTSKRMSKTYHSHFSSSR